MRYKLFLSFLLLISVSFSQKAQADYLWDMKKLFETEVDYRQEKRSLLSDMKKFQQKSYKDLSDESELARLLEDLTSLQARAAKFAVVGILMTNIDYKSDLYKEMYKFGQRIELEMEELATGYKLRIAKLSKNQLNNMLRRSTKLKRYEHYINRLLFDSSVLKSATVEQVIRRQETLSSDYKNMYYDIVDSSLDLPKLIDSDGKAYNTGFQNYSSLVRSFDEKKYTYGTTQFFKNVEPYRNFFASLLANRVKSDLEKANARGFESGVDLLFYLRDGMPAGTAKHIVQSARKNKQLFQEFFEILAKELGKTQLNYNELRRGVRLKGKTYTVEESRQITLSAIKPLGKEVAKKLNAFLDKPLMHLAATENKRRMWGAYPPVEGFEHHTIMYYDGSIGSSNRFMRACLANLLYEYIPKNKMPFTRDDPPTYLNGSLYFGAMLYSDYLIEKSKAEEKRQYLLYAANNIATSYFRYAVFAAFELEIENAMKVDKVISADFISATYLKTLREFYGENVLIDKKYADEWITLDQTFFSYEHQFWPISMALAASLDQRFKNNDPDLLKIFGKVYEEAEFDRSYQLLKVAGIDLSSEKLYKPLFTRMRELLDRL